MTTRWLSSIQFNMPLALQFVYKGRGESDQSLQAFANGEFFWLTDCKNVQKIGVFSREGSFKHIRGGMT